MLRALLALSCRLLLLVATAAVCLGLVLVSLRFPVFAILAVISGLAKAIRCERSPGSSHGSARVATEHEIASRGLYDDDRGKGLIFGRTLGGSPTYLQGVLGLISPWQRSEGAVIRFFAAFIGSKQYRDRLLRVINYVHVLTVAPAGSGKGAAAVIPNLLHYSGNVLVFDTKGEIWDEVHRHRERVHGKESIRLDPGGVHDEQCGKKGASFNPLIMCDPQRKDFLETCDDIAAMIVIRPPDEKDPHFLDSCQMVTKAIFAFICSQPDPRLKTFETFRNIVSDPVMFDRVIAEMKTRGKLLATQAGVMDSYKGKELGALRTTIHRMSGFMDNVMVQECTSTCSFPAKSIRTGDIDVFIVVPGYLMTSLAPLVRVWMGVLTRYYTRSKPSEAKKLLVICDEAAVLGKFKPIEEGITLMRGYGIRMWLIFQSINQLKTCYGDNAQTLLANMTTQQYFCINDYETAEMLSKRIGDATILIETLNKTTGTSLPHGGGKDSQGSSSYSTSRTYAQHGRRYLTPDEIMALPDWLGMTFIMNMRMIPTQLVRYYNSREFRERREGSGIYGTGAVRRLGIGSSIKAAVVLLVSLAFAAAMATLPPPRPAGNASGYGQAFDTLPLPDPPVYYFAPPYGR